MRRVLMLSYRFAPQGGAGSLRTVKFAKYLPALGWQPIVHTVANPHWGVWDDELSNEVPPEAIVYRSRTFEPEAAGEHAGGQLLDATARRVSADSARRLRRTLGAMRRRMRVWVLIPDRQIAWVPWATLRTLSFVRRHRPDVLYSSSPPHSVQLVGLAVQRLTGLPWVVDFRDLWMQSIHRQELYKRRWRHRIETALERAVVRNADRLIATTEPNRDELVDKYGAAGRVVAIPNGYDAADFERPAVPPDDLDPTCFNMTMTGQVVKLVDMRPFFRALAQAVARNKELRGRLHVRLIGADPAPYAALIRELGLAEQVRYMPYMPHEQVLQYVRTSSVLFLCHIPDWISAGAKLSVKLFEYFAAGRSILAMTPAESLTAGLIAEAGTGMRVDPDDVDGITTAVLELFRRWGDRRGESRPSASFLERFERGRLTERLAGVLEDAQAARRSARSQTPMLVTPASPRDRRAA
jgi:glycosyltransferase involved in cell wall biosynthesis